MNIHVDRGELNIAGLRVDALASRIGTPIAVYNADTMVERFYAFAEAFSDLRAMVSFDTGAVPNTHVLNSLVKRGAGLSIRTGEDLERAWLSGVPMARVVYGGLGRSDDDVRAALDGLYSPMFQTGRLVEGRPPYYRGPIGWFSVETRMELEQIARIANGVRIACNAVVAVDVTGRGEWGASFEHALALFKEFNDESRLRLRGLHMHCGQVARTIEGFVACVRLVVELVQQIKATGKPISILNLGGGFASDEVEAGAPTPAHYAAAVESLLVPLVESGVKIVIEPGWSLCAGSCAMISRVLGVCDGACSFRIECDAVPWTAIARSSAVEPTVASSVPGVEPGVIGQVGKYPFISRPTIKLSAQSGELIVWRTGGYRSREDVQSICEVMLMNGKPRIILPRSSVTDLLLPELETQEVML